MGSSFYVPLYSRDSLVPAHEVELREGKIDAQSSCGMPLVVSALGTTHVALRGAEAQIAFKSDHLAVQVTEGTARVGASRKWISLEKGQMLTLPAQGGPSAPAPGVEAPEWTAGAGCSPGLALGNGDGLAVLGGCWKPMARAASYVVELSRDARFATIEATEPSTTPSWSKALAGGRYFVRVRAIDQDGLVGETSAPRSLGSFAVKAPPGSTVDAVTRTFTVPQGRSLELADPTGLESALDNGGFLPAQRFIVVDSAPSHVVRMRFKDDPGSQGSLVLQRRALQADVAFTPKLAHWPQDPIDIKVTLSDASGVVDPSLVSPKIQMFSSG